MGGQCRLATPVGPADAHALVVEKIRVLAKSRKEKRVWQRLPVGVPVFVRGRDAAGRDFVEFTSLLNVSAGGVLWASRRHVPRSHWLVLEIPAAPVPHLKVSPPVVRKVKARAVRTLYSNGSRLYGLRFARPIIPS